MLDKSTDSLFGETDRAIEMKMLSMAGRKVAKNFVIALGRAQNFANLESS